MKLFQIFVFIEHTLLYYQTISILSDGNKGKINTVSCCLIGQLIRLGEYPQRMQHDLFGFSLSSLQKTERIASSNTDSNPLCVSALHSKYLTAPKVFAIAKP